MAEPPGLAARIRAKLDADMLPRHVEAKRFVGYGTWHLCSACDDAIHPSQIEYAFEAPGGQTVRFHLGCAGLWEVERRRGWSAEPRAGHTRYRVQIIRERALSALAGDPGTWHCIPCWAWAAGLLDRDRLALRILARTFPTSGSARPGQAVFDVAQCDRWTHSGEGSRLALCVRVEPPHAE